MKKFIMVLCVVIFVATIVGFAPVCKDKENVTDTFSSANTIEFEIAEKGVLLATDPITHEETTYRYEYTENKAGNGFYLMYDAKIEWPEDDAEILARFLNHEGGTAEEKAIIADIIAARIVSDEFPDTVKDVLTQKGSFYINASFWNNQKELSKEDVLIAKEALEKDEHTSYSHYMLLHSKEFTVIPSGVKTLETDNYIFY